MATATPCIDQQTACPPTLFLAFELGENTWKRGFTTGAAQRPRERQVAAGDCPTVLEESRRAKQRFGLPENTRVISGYEAGRDGFWLHRFFVRHGRENAVVDSASIAVHRRYRRAKTDRLDVPKLLTMLLRSCGRRAEGLECGTRAQGGRGRPAASPPCTPDRAARPDPGQQSHARMAGRLGSAEGTPRGCRSPARAGAPGGRLPVAPRLAGPPEARVAAGVLPDCTDHGS